MNIEYKKDSDSTVSGNGFSASNITITSLLDILNSSKQGVLLTVSLISCLPVFFITSFITMQYFFFKSYIFILNKKTSMNPLHLPGSKYNVSYIQLNAS